MYKLILLSFFFIGSITEIEAQIGINTDSPLNFFHIDSKKNTSGSINTDDDIVVDSNGNMGIGTIAPQAKLDILGNIKITDGTQNLNYGLVSDANGLASWKKLTTSMRIDMSNLGTGRTLTITSDSVNTFYPTGGYITIEPGKSVIRASFYNSFAYEKFDVGYFLPNGRFIQVRYALSSDPSVYVAANVLNPAGDAYVTVTGVHGAWSMSGSGFWMVNNPTNNNLKLYLFFHVTADAITAGDGKVLLVYVGASSWYENVIAISRITG